MAEVPLPTPTDNAVPSTDIRDAVYAGAMLDKVVTSTDLKYTDRLGGEHYTVDGIKAEGDKVVEETRQNLIPLSRQYMTLAAAQADIANIPVNSAIYVRNADGTSLADEYINNSGILTATGRKMPSQQMLDAVSETANDSSDFLATAQTGLYFGNNETIPFVIDSSNKLILGYDSHKDEVIGAGMITSEKAKSISDSAIDEREANGNTGLYVGSGTIIPLMIDGNNRLILGYDAEKDSVVGAGLNQSTITPERKPLPLELRPIAKAVNHTLGYGQSLSIGATATTIISSSQPYSNITFSTGPRAANNDVSSQKPLVEDNTSPAPDGGTNRGETFCSGMANYALTLAAIDNGIIPSKHVIFASTAGKGGTKLANLIKGTAWYNDHFLLHVTGQYDLNHDSAVHIIPIAQGETDLDQSPPTAASAWRAMAEQFQIDAESDIKAVNGQTSPVFVQFSQCSYKAALSPNICLSQLDLVQKNKKFRLATPQYHLPRAADGTHLTSVGYKWDGAYRGRDYKELMFDGIESLYINPVSATLRGNVLTLKFDRVRVLPLRLDNENLAATTDYGFRVNDSNGKVNIMSSRGIDDTVVFELATIPVGNTVVRYALDYLGEGLNIVNGASGNLRDSDTSFITINNVNYPMFQVAPHFELQVIKVGE
ncbi:hypothetical protein ACK6VP_25680 [Klebsiella pneumoniae]|uniref:hypothetical protein n=1 Tax=Klebsiella pneumoniae TaxID=573 RepID=UPI000E2AC949|nr:hypothetical protein [Klebsiella pneumoniae]SWW18539.1 flagellar biosynthesis, cell-distal portion of basal-body rod [Klebsiella pneumoniae]SWW34050.1 flagellar biosynthesis, cell-distal portion of basal-body rod [Klebsiella pneumoniae]SWW60697.1 flagellar biosynthesis, cell-distal portion of basal-body rod [Klebsiella pneumoniae]